MAINQQNPQQLLPELYGKLSKLEYSIRAELGPNVFDYMYIISKDYHVDIDLPQLSENTTQLLKKYIQVTSQILSIFGIKLQLTSRQLGEQFLQASHEIYAIRYLQARHTYPDYQLLRVLSPFEQAMLLSDPKNRAPEKSITIRLTDEIIVSETGDIDFEATINHEKKYHAIAILFSSITEVKDKKAKFLDDFNDLTFKGLLSFFYENELLDLFEGIVEIGIELVTAQIYGYIGRGISLQDAKANLNSYYTQSIGQKGNIFHEELAGVEQQLNQEIADGLSQIKGLTKETIKTITQEFKELFLFYLKEGIFIPHNFYLIKFRSPEQFAKEDQSYHLLVDSYMIFMDGRLSELPTETYDIEHTLEAKSKIFEAVTNGITNPYFTLDHYIAEEDGTTTT